MRTRLILRILLNNWHLYLLILLLLLHWDSQLFEGLLQLLQNLVLLRCYLIVLLCNYRISGLLGIELGSGLRLRHWTLRIELL